MHAHTYTHSTSLNMLQNIMHTKVIAFSYLFYFNTNVKFTLRISLALDFAVVLIVAVIISRHIYFAFLCILESVLIFCFYM